jgi:DNA-binding response OmpR family regulator
MASALAPKRPTSVLIVEDDQAARRAIARILRLRGFAVSEAATIAQALHQLAKPPEWVLLDLMLPDGCGTRVIEQIRAGAIATHVCVITGCGQERIWEARDAGAEYAFTKPLDVSRLMALLERNAQQHGARAHA